MSVAAVFLAVLALNAPGPKSNLEARRESIQRPAPKALVHGETPRLVLLVQVVERKDQFGHESRTTYFLHDPSEPETGFRRVFEGRGQRQPCRFLTPLFGGVGLAASWHRLFWFDLLAGKPGETIAVDPENEWLSGSEIWFRTKEGLNSLDVLRGTLSTYPIRLSKELRIGEKLLLGASPIEGRFHAVRIDLDQAKLVDLGALPEVFHSQGDFVVVHPAGPQARDGSISRTATASPSGTSRPRRGGCGSSETSISSG